MPGYERAEVSAELKVVTSDRAENPPQAQLEAATNAAGETGLAHEAGPETTVLAGSREEVLQAPMSSGASVSRALIGYLQQGFFRSALRCSQDALL